MMQVIEGDPQVLVDKFNKIYETEYILDWSVHKIEGRDYMFIETIKREGDEDVKTETTK